MEKKELKKKLGHFQEEISTDLSNDLKSIILETDQRKILLFMRVFWEDQQKYLQSSQNDATYHPINSDADV